MSCKQRLLLLSLIVFTPLAGVLSSSAQASPEVIEQWLGERHVDDLPKIRKRKQLRALVTYSRTDFSIQPNGRALGLQVELLSNFEKLLNEGVKRAEQRTQIVLVPTTFDRLLPDLLEGKGDIAAALLTVTPERQKKVAFVPGLQKDVLELVVTHKRVRGIESLDDLAGRRVYVLRNSSYAEHLRALNRDFANRKLKPIKVVEADEHLLSEDILEMVNAGVVDITVVDDYKALLWAGILPNVRVLEDLPLTSGNQLGWAVRKNNPELLASLKRFSRKVKKGTLLGNILLSRYFNNTSWITNPLADDERAKFNQAIESFAKYAGLYDFDVLAVAAQAYQESQLDHSRRSPRGAIGIMQMLPTTAADPNVDIPDISQPETNIHAGIKYLAFLRDRYFCAPEISSEDRMALSWAAYNAGPANVRRMRSKAKQLGLNPNIWFGHVEVAASKTVGREPVNYVRNIFKYYVAYSLVREQLLTPQQIRSQPKAQRVQACAG